MKAWLTRIMVNEALGYLRKKASTNQEVKMCIRDRMYIVPGYVCMHAHCGGGHDFNECTEEAFRAAVKAHQKHGATSIFQMCIRDRGNVLCS